MRYWKKLFLNLGLLTSKTAKSGTLKRLEGPLNPDQDDGVKADQPIGSVLGLGFIDLGKQAESLYDILRRFGYSRFRPPFGNFFRPIGWDWRLPVYQKKVQDLLSGTIDHLHNETSTRMVVIAHSTGGLVLRALLESTPALAAKIERVIAFGVPWAGTLKSLRYLDGQGGFGPLNAKEAQQTLRHSHGAFDLLPPDPDKTDMTDEWGPLNLFGRSEEGPPPTFVQTSPLIDYAWMPAGAEFQFLREMATRADQHLGRRAKSFQIGKNTLEIVNIVGWGAKTDTKCRILTAGPGAKLRFEKSDDGDGTVPRRSAAWLQRGNGVSTFQMPLGLYPLNNIPDEHSALWETQPGEDLLRFFINGEPWRDFVYAAVDAEDANKKSPRLRIRAVALDRSGNRLQDARVRVRLLKPNDATEHSLEEDGRGTITISRANLHQTVAGFFRFEVVVHWTEGGTAQSKSMVFNVPR